MLLFASVRLLGTLEYFKSIWQLGTHKIIGQVQTGLLLHPNIRFVFQSVIDRSEKSMNLMLPTRQTEFVRSLV